MGYFTRKSGDRTFTEFLKLATIKEVHLLYDMRGPYLRPLLLAQLSTAITKPKNTNPRALCYTSELWFPSGAFRRGIFLR